jgi:hypothetical protein
MTKEAGPMATRACTPPAVCPPRLLAAPPPPEGAPTRATLIHVVPVPGAAGEGAAAALAALAERGDPCIDPDVLGFDMF